MTKVLALKGARYGVDVKRLAPSYLAKALNDVFSAAKAGRAPIKRPPQRRVSQLNEFARTLPGRAGSFVTRQGAAVDGGASCFGSMMA